MLHGPLFLFEDGKNLTRDYFVGAMRGALQTAGVDPSKYAGHTFRIGTASTAGRNGVQDSLIKTMGHYFGRARPTHSIFGHQGRRYVQWLVPW